MFSSYEFHLMFSLNEMCYQHGANCSEPINMGYTYTVIGSIIYPKDVRRLLVDWSPLTAGERL